MRIGGRINRSSSGSFPRFTTIPMSVLTNLVEGQRLKIFTIASHSMSRIRSSLKQRGLGVCSGENLSFALVACWCHPTTATFLPPELSGGVLAYWFLLHMTWVVRNRSIVPGLLPCNFPCQQRCSLP